MGFYFGNVNISGGSASGYDMANKSLSNLDAAGNAKFTAKQNVLVSGTNIKTINGVSVLGEGNIEVGEGGTITVNQSYDATSTYAQSGTAVAEAVLTKANTSLNNLSSDGQMIIDSQNGTISNCVLEIPQNLNLVFNNGTVTLKADSTIVRTGSTYQTLTITSDVTWSSSTQANAKQYLYISNSGNAVSLYANQRVEKIGSGTSLPADGSTYSLFFNTTDKVIYSWSDNAWSATNYAYPLAVIETDENHIIKGFAKDSNGNDMIFNGACFLGNQAVVYPNVKGLKADGFNTDGSLKSTNVTTNSVQIIEMPADTSGGICLDGSAGAYLSDGNAHYDSKANMYYRNSSDTDSYMPLLDFSVNASSVVSDFALNKPVRIATVEMLDNVQAQVDTNTTAIAGKQDTLTFDATPTNASTNPVTSGGVYTVLSGKQADITTITGYDATKTQTLKNVSGVLTWVDDGE